FVGDVNRVVETFVLAVPVVALAGDNPPLTTLRHRRLVRLRLHGFRLRVPDLHSQKLDSPEWRFFKFASPHYPDTVSLIRVIRRRLPLRCQYPAHACFSFKSL